MSAAVAAAPPSEHDAPKSAEEREREIVIVDLAGDGKTIQATTSFTMTWKDPETGRIHVGTFSAQRPSLGQLGQIAVLKAKMNGGEKVDAQTDFLHEMMSSLQVILTDFPDWWKPNDFFDARPLREVWDHVRRWVDNFRSKRMG
jgi:hypothetical protein